jgi:serine/threonine protein kinase
MLSRGDTLGERFRLVDKIGEGGMGVVWLARDERLNIDVALKVLHGALLGDEHSAARLRNEARAAAKIAHPGICRVLDVGEHEGAPFLVMELLLGRSLAELVSREGRLAPAAAVDVAECVLDALAAAHAEGVLHRDLKPENVFLCEDGAVKLLDFGVAKILADDERVRLTRTGALIGTPAYMAPEQAQGHPSDERADLWSLGVMLFEMLSGELPYSAANYQGMLVAIATSAPPSILARCPALDRDLAAIVDRALARSESERWPDARAFIEALRGWRARQGVERQRAPTPTGAGKRAPRRSPREQAILTLTDPAGPASTHERWRRGLWRAASAVALVAVLYGALRSAQGTRASEPLPTVARADAGAIRVVSHEHSHDDAATVIADARETSVSSPSPLSAPSTGARDGATAAPDATRPERGARRIRGRRPDGGAAGIGRDPDF